MSDEGIPNEIAAVAEALRAGRLTAAALLDRTLARITAEDSAIGSFVAIDEPGARLAAEESDRRLAAGAARSPLEGIPLSIKDNILAAGLPASWGSRALATFRPETDELPVARLRAAGAVILGKTNVPELTLEGYTRNDLFGVTRNPWNLALTPGGSSGGAAASVAAGFVPAAIGTDGGGSIRRPASHTGLIGWKPSAGAIPRIDGFPPILGDFEVIGTLTRSLADLRILDMILRAPDARDPRSLVSRAEGPGRAGRLRVLSVPRFGASPVDPEVASATADFATALRESGAEVQEGGLFFDLQTMGEIWRVVSRAGVASLLRLYPDLPMKAGETARAMLAEGAGITGAELSAALQEVGRLRQHLATLFRAHDLVLTPTAAALPWPAEEPYPQVIEGMPAGPRDHAVFTGWVNIGGLPAISLPVALSRSGLPIGVQLVGGFAQDDALLAAVARLAHLLRADRPGLL
ncbi:amidase [Acidisoma sp. C75]